MKKLLCALILLCGSAYGTTAITGHIVNVSTGAAPKSFVRFWLRGCGGNQPRVNGAAVIAPSQGSVYYFDFPSDASGNVSGTVYANRNNAGTGDGEIECGLSKISTYYGLQLFAAGKPGPEIAIFAQNSSLLDISNVVPLSVTPPTPEPSQIEVIEDEGTALTSRKILDFTGSGVTCTDDPTNLQTVCTITGNSNASSIQGIAVDPTPPTNGQTLTYSSTSNSYVPVTGGGGGSWPTTSMPVAAGQALFPISTGQVQANSFLPTTATTGSAPSPGTLDFTGCSSQTPALTPFSFVPLANGHFAEEKCIAANISGTPATAGVPTTVYPQWFNNSGQKYNQMGNRLLGVIYSPGLNGIITDATHQGSAIGAVWTNEFAGASQDYDQELTIYAEALPSGANTNFHGHAGGEVDMSVNRGSFADRRTGFAGNPPTIFATYSAQMSRVQPSTMATSGGFWANFRAYMFNGVAGAIAGTQNFANYVSEGVDGGPCSSSGCTFYGFRAIAPTTPFANANYGFKAEAHSANANDWNIFSAGVNSSGTSTGFNDFQGPTTFGRTTHAAAGYQLDILGTVKLQGSAGAALLDGFGSTSGHAQIGVAAAAGTPNMLLLPTSTGANGTCLSTDGGNPQQTAWITCGGGGGGSGITTLNGLTPLIQTFAVNNAGSNVALSINSASATHTFSAAITGTIPGGNLQSDVVRNCTPTGIPITCSISTQNLNLGIAGTWGATALNANVVQSITPDTNVTGTILSQNLTLGWAGQLGVTRGGLNLSAIAVDQVPVGSASNVYTARTLPNGILQYSTSTHLFTAASALVDPTTTDGDLITRSGGVPARVAGPTSPDGVNYALTIKSTGGVSGLPTWGLPGVAGRSVSGASDTVVATDRSNWITYTGSSATAISLASAASFGSNFVFGVAVTGTVGGTGATLTATTSKFQPENSSTFVMLQGENCTFTSYDNVDYFHRCSPGQLFAGTNMTISRSQFGITLNGDSNATSAAGTLTSNAILLGGGSKAITALGSLGTTTTVLHGNASGAPSFGAVSLATDVTGNVSTTNFNSGTGASSSTFWRGDGTWATPAGAGNVTGPGSAVADNVTSFNGTSGTLIKDSGVASGNLVTAASNYTNAHLVQSAGANKTTSDSGIATANVPTMAANGTSGNLIQSAASDKTQSDAGIATANVVTQTSNGANGQVATYTAANKVLVAATALPNGITATTQSAKDNSTKVATTAYVDAATGLTTGTSVTLTAPRQYFVCTGTCTITVPVPAAGYEFCVLNDDNVATVITLSAIGSSARYENTARTAYGTAGTGTFVSGGAVGDKVCLLGRDSTHYLTASFNGTWTAN